MLVAGGSMLDAHRSRSVQQPASSNQKFIAFFKKLRQILVQLGTASLERDHD